MNNSKKEETYQRYITMSEIIKEDEIAQNLLDNLVIKCCDYVSIVVKNESALRLQRYRLEPEDYRVVAEELDRKRRSAHEALISALHSFNRYCINEFEETPVGGIYSYDPLTIRDRVAVAEWAVELVIAIFKYRKI